MSGKVSDGRRGRRRDGHQKLPDGYYHLDRMIRACARQGRRRRLLRHLHGRPRCHRGHAHQGHPPLHIGRTGRLDPAADKIVSF
jgi:hypothetical protein